MIDIYPEKLLYSVRDDIIDEEYFGFICLFKNFSPLIKIGADNGAQFYLRSLSKPIQASVMADFDTISFFGFNKREVAIMCGSHAGTDEHIEVVRSILEKISLDESYLCCPPSAPLDIRDYRGKPLSVCNNCSGKHAMMLSLCRQNNWDFKTYLDFKHLLQKLIYKKHLDLSCAKAAPISLDGCGAPVFALSMPHIAKAFSSFFEDKKYAPIVNAVMHNPYIFGGNNRLDSEIIELGNGNLFSKVGAGGFVLVYNIQKNEILIVKMSQNNNEPRRIITLNALYQLGWIKTNPAPNEVFNQKGAAVAKYVCNFSLL